jgi:predicted Rossmann fold flavoprotein
VRALAGISVERVRLSLLDLDEEVASEGPLLCTHWGVSGPAVLRASAWGARALHTARYRCRVRIDWLAGTQASTWIDTQRRTTGARPLRATPPPGLPRRLWEALANAASIPDGQVWAQLTSVHREVLAERLNACDLTMTSKGVFKEEFVTAGGVARTELDWRTMESRRAPGLFFAGECIDVDAITGGYNFQNAWTTGWLAGQAMALRLTGR